MFLLYRAGEKTKKKKINQTKFKFVFLLVLLNLVAGEMLAKLLSPWNKNVLYNAVNTRVTSKSNFKQIRYNRRTECGAASNVLAV